MTGRACGAHTCVGSPGPIDGAGLPGIAGAMAFESCGLPLPSELVMPLSGFLAVERRGTLRGAAVAGALKVGRRLRGDLSDYGRRQGQEGKGEFARRLRSLG